MESTKITAWEKTQIYLNTLNHMFIATVSIYVTWLCFQMGFERSRTLHVWLCTLGVSQVVVVFECFFTWCEASNSTCASYRRDLWMRITIELQFVSVTFYTVATRSHRWNAWNTCRCYRWLSYRIHVQVVTQIIGIINGNLIEISSGFGIFFVKILETETSLRYSTHMK